MTRFEIGEWLLRVMTAGGLTVTPMDLGRSNDWELRRGAISHKTGRFFEVVGVIGENIAQPMIAQSEIGTLGFFFRTAPAGLEALVQAKIEPGNVGGVQLAPSLQATASNIDRAHGGAPPPGLALFRAPNGRVVCDTLQSKQGSRFLGKSNRNLALLFEDLTYESAPHRWMPVRSVLDVLHEDFLINTDARSVLVCTPWELLADGHPFATVSHPITPQLARSFSAERHTERMRALKAKLERLRDCAVSPASCSLEELPGCQIEPNGVVRAPSAGFVVRHIQVSSQSREVQRWDQPIIDSTGDGRAELFAVRISGILHFGFQAITEPGLSRRVELGPSRMAWPGISSAAEGVPTDATLLASCRQSDEGGRFFHDVTNYQLWDLGDSNPDPTLDWLTLSEIAALLNGDGVFTNEARTLLSLILRYL